MTPQASPNRTTLTWLIPITLLVAVSAMVGGLIARQVYMSAKPPSDSPPPATSAPESSSDHRPPDPNTVYFVPFAAGDPQFQPVRDTIQNYFNAVNRQNYQLWRLTMSPGVVQQQTEQAWIDGLRTTKDKDMTVYRIEATDRGADVFGTFTSTQDPADAPADLPVGCIRWWMVWPMENSSGGLHIDSPSVIKKKC